MTDLRYDATQQFTCAQCGNCCRRGWEIAVTDAEVERYRRSGAARWFRTAAEAPEGQTAEPFERIGRSLWRIRKRQDGACGFLSPENRCRLHEELGGPQKPLTCRLYPFQFHETTSGPVMTASFACPTVVAGSGKPVQSQLPDLRALRAEGERDAPARPASLLLTDGRPLEPRTLATLRSVFRAMLERSPDLATAALRIAATLDDLTRHRVVRLAPDAFAEYVELTTRHAVEHGRPPAPREPSRLGRLFFRGLLFTALAGGIQRTEGRGLAVRLSLFRLLLHVEGLGPPACGVDLGRIEGWAVPWSDAGAAALARRYLTASIETLGTGRLPVADEMCLAAGTLVAAAVLGARHAADQGKTAVDGAALAQGLMDAADLGHAAGGGFLGAAIRTFTGGTEAFILLAGARLP